ncbi:MAG: hypothetical protein KatS3mg114_1341 [Planctomycetaceae bacterium]|nr:MAG: hypothetical protein KatS3mg114_1341 [Planctomycetaceae bacterium]
MKTGRVWWLLWVCSLPVGCALPPRATPPLTNPVQVRAQDAELVWERAVEVLHQYHFEIEREDRQAGLIETRYRVGSGWLEPWHTDSVGVVNRWESTLQSIRRKVFITLTPLEGGFLVGVEALKELEDAAGAVPRTGRATFLENTPLIQEGNVVTGPPAPTGWIPRGRDLPLEQALLSSITAPLF